MVNHRSNITSCQPDEAIRCGWQPGGANFVSHICTRVGSCQYTCCSGVLQEVSWQELQDQIILLGEMGPGKVPPGGEWMTVEAVQAVAWAFWVEGSGCDCGAMYFPEVGTIQVHLTRPCPLKLPAGFCFGTLTTTHHDVICLTQKWVLSLF